MMMISPVFACSLRTALIFLFLGLYQFASAKTIYMSPQGDDNNDGLTKEAPVKQLSRAIEIAEDGDTILSFAGEYVLSEQVINKPSDVSVTIQGSTDANFENPDIENTPSLYNGWEVNRALTIINEGTGRVALNFKDFIFEDGNATNEENGPGKGGGIYASGIDLNITGSIIRNNIAASDLGVGNNLESACGGGLYIEGGDLTLAECQFINNKAAALGLGPIPERGEIIVTAFPGFGGGVYFLGSGSTSYFELAMTACVFLSNVAQCSTAGGESAVLDGCGGGLFINVEPPVSRAASSLDYMLDGNLFENNSANKSVKGNGFGGGVYLQNPTSGTPFSDSKITICNGSFVGNTAHAGEGDVVPGTGGSGGGCYLNGASGLDVFIKGVDFEGNSGSCGTSSAFGTGGSIAASGLSFLGIRESSFVGEFGAKKSRDGRGGSLDIAETIMSIFISQFEGCGAIGPLIDIPGVYTAFGGTIFFRTDNGSIFGPTFDSDTTIYIDSKLVSLSEMPPRGISVQGSGEVIYLDKPNPVKRQPVRGVLAPAFAHRLVANTFVQSVASSQSAVYNESGDLFLVNNLISGFQHFVENVSGTGELRHNLAEGDMGLLAGMNLENIDATSFPNFSQANADLQFDSNNGIYILGSESEAIDAGYDIAQFDPNRPDILGTIRPLGNAFDIGCYESSFSSGGGITLPQVISQLLSTGFLGADANNDSIVDSADAQTIINNP